MHDRSSVEVLIVSFNSVDELRQTLSTLLEHTPAPPVQMTIAVLDNASADGSADMVASDFPHVRLLRSTINVGFGRATNRLAATSEADFLFILNSDVIVNEDVIPPLISALDAAPEILVAAPRLTYPDGRLQYSANHFPSLPYEGARILSGTRLGRIVSRFFDAETVIAHTHCADDTRLLERSWYADSIWATAWLVRRSEFVSDGFDETFPLYDEDLDFCVRAKSRGRKLVYVPEVNLIHLGGSSSTVAGKNAAMSAARYHYYKLHHGYFSALCFKMLERGLPALVALVAALPKRAGASRA